MKNIKTIEKFHTIKETENAIFVFSADWCPDCRVIEPILPEIEKEFPMFQFYHVDRDQFIDLCGELDVFGIPSFIAFKEGTEAGRFVSKDRKTKEEVEQFIRELN
ncbi:thioredoxin family protein [Bacillus sp. Marseille-P3661]|uniref:thioredoxin family protein n=1 Tax=Bacillus sp. Marseille-P3661 TaxID=1936234 RepID=UPI000C8557D8|nr:thioredoxin family protein [Bacillus sp. Marseille-P3661]